MRSCCVFDSPRFCSSCCLSFLQSFFSSLWFSPFSSTLWKTNILCSLDNEDFDTFVEDDFLTGYEPNDNHNSEAFEPNIQESSVESCPRMTASTITSPSTLRSFQHCSPRSEKMQRSADEIITLVTKVCRSVSRRRPSVMEGDDPLWNSLTHKFHTSDKFRATTQKVRKSGNFWNDMESRFSLIVTQRFENTNSRPIMTEEVLENSVK